MKTPLLLPHYLASDVFNTEVIRQMKLLTRTNSVFILMTLNFDHFNYINELFSYEVGDLVIEKITDHFSSLLRDNEYFSRIHTDHFIFSLWERDPRMAEQRFYELAELADTLADILPPHYTMTARGGMVMVKDSLTPLSALIDKANYAQSKTSQNTSSSYCLYDSVMDVEVQWQKIITGSMESALKNHEFELYLQPKNQIRNGYVAGAEALVRWHSPEYGMIYPDRFIPVMEQNGFIRQLDFFMLEEVCLFLKDMNNAGFTGFPISVNFSKAHLATEHLADHIYQTVRQSGILPGQIEIEFTESLSSEDFQKLIHTILELKNLGLKVSLDDFGSAYSSLNCLKNLPIDIIKIDKEFLNASSGSDREKLILTKILELVQSLGMVSVMEGIESQEQVDYLKKTGCDLGQGYFYARPMPVSDFTQYLLSKKNVAGMKNFII